jgi:hypothetical protein
MNRVQFAAAVGIALVLVGVGLGFFFHKKDPGPDPFVDLPNPSASATGVIDIVPIAADASDDVDGSDADAKATGSGVAYDPSHLKACCVALQANAASMPPPQNLYAQAAAQYCLAAVASVNSPTQKDQVLAGIRNTLKGGTLPANCR